MRSALATAASTIVSEAGSGSRAVPAKNFHLTLAFLGAVPHSRLEELSSVAAEFARAFSAEGLPVRFVLDTVEYWRKSQVLSATASETPPTLISVGESLQRSLTAAGFDLGDSARVPFRPHVTLVRKVRAPISLSSIEPQAWSFSDFSLVESRRASIGSAYSTVKKYLLDKCD